MLNTQQEECIKLSASSVTRQLLSVFVFGVAIGIDPAEMRGLSVALGICMA